MPADSFLLHWQTRKKCTPNVIQRRLHPPSRPFFYSMAPLPSSCVAATLYSKLVGRLVLFSSFFSSPPPSRWLVVFYFASVANGQVISFLVQRFIRRFAFFPVFVLLLSFVCVGMGVCDLAVRLSLIKLFLSLSLSPTRFSFLVVSSD